jgi:effector-binding domain-containing protein
MEINKNFPLQKSNNLTERKLSNFCNVNKRNKKYNKLSDEKIKLLEEIPYWYWEKEDTFYKIYYKLKDYVELNNKIPLCTSKNKEEIFIARWCSNRRTDKRKNKLSEEKIKLLEKILGWNWGNDEIKKEKSFDDVYKELKDWVMINKKIPSYGSKDLVEKSFGSWCSRLRECKNNDKLSSEKIKLLEEIPGWHWGKEELFYKKYDELKEWIETNNKIPNSKSKNIIESKLGKWCSRMRYYKRNNTLSEEKIKLLEEISGWYWEINK